VRAFIFSWGVFLSVEIGTVDVDAGMGGYHRIAAFASKAPCPPDILLAGAGKRRHSSPRQGLSHAHRVPAPAAGGGNGSGVEGVGNGAKGTVKANKYRPFSASNPAEHVGDS